MSITSIGHIGYMKFLGSSKITPKLRIRVLKDVAEKLEVKDGDHIIFYEKEDGEILIKKG